MIAFVNDNYLTAENASINISDLAIQRGYGVFDFFRTKNFIPLFQDDYMDRFFNSATALRLKPLQSRDEIIAIINELGKRNNLPEAGFKLTLTGGYSADGYQPAVNPNLIITQHKLPAAIPGIFITGVKVITHHYQRELPAVKSINYLMGIWLQQKLIEQNAADVLYFHNGLVSEFPRANVFMVTRDQTIVTPDEHILHGVTRKKVLELAATKYGVEKREVSMREIKNAAEVFMTSTTKRLLPVCQIDETVIGNGTAGPVTTLLNEDFVNMENDFLQRAALVR